MKSLMSVPLPRVSMLLRLCEGEFLIEVFELGGISSAAAWTVSSHPLSENVADEER